MGCVSRDQLESRIDNFVRLQGGDENVEDPEEYEDTRGDGFDTLKNAKWIKLFCFQNV